MVKLWLVLLSLICLSVVSSHAQVYRWTDKDGKVHFTDDPSRIPPDRVDHSRELSPDDAQGQFTPSALPTPAPATPPATTVERPAATHAESLLRLRQKESDLKQQIAASETERQGYLKTLESMRPVRTNPAFGRKRRRVEGIGQSLATAERQLDTLRAELHQVQAEIQRTEQSQLSIPSPQSRQPAVAFDRQGHDRSYWQRRLDAVQTRLQQARQQRQTILEQLSAEHQGTYGQHGKAVLELTADLKRADQDIRSAEAELQTLQQEAARAGAPAEWLQ